MYIHFTSSFGHQQNLIIKLALEEEKYIKDIIWIINHTAEFVDGVSTDYVDYSDKYLDQDYLENFGERNDKTEIVELNEIYWNLFVFINNWEKVNPGNSSVDAELPEKFMINYGNLKSVSREFLKYILPKMIEKKSNWGHWNFRKQDYIFGSIKTNFNKFVKNIDYHYDCAIAKDIIE